MAPLIKIAVIQFEATPLNTEENFTKASQYIHSAADQGCHLAVLPEYHLTGWHPEDPKFKEASINSEEYLPRYQNLAKSLNISLVPGSICEILPPPEDSGSVEHQDKFANIAYFIAAGSGEILGRYQKKNLWLTERHHLTSCGSDAHRAFVTPWEYPDGRAVKVGLLICWDLAFPEAFRALVQDGADMIIIPSCWHLSDVNEEALSLNPQSEKVFLESTTVTRAFENTAAIVFCNATGMSGITMPHQGCLTRAQFDEEKMLVSQIDLRVLGLAEENYQIRADMKDANWGYAFTMQEKS